MDRVAKVQIDPSTPWRCLVAPELAIREGDLCVIGRDKDLEFGRVMKLETDGVDVPNGSHAPRVLRRATLQDQSKADENALMGKMARGRCEEAAAKHDLKLRIIRIRYSFDRSVLHVVYGSDEKIDTREMSKDLSQELRAHVDMKQIGVRDEAGVIGGLGTCGRRLCCCSWLRQFSSINVKMAKAQGLSLNPSAIGGNCGRLKCCLRYEVDNYKALSRGLPRVGARVESADGAGFVIDVNILPQRLKVRMDDARILDLGADQVREVAGRRSRRRRDDDEGSGLERSESESAWDA